MAPVKIKGTPEEREQFMKQIFINHYSNAETASTDLSVNKANEQFKKKYGSMLRNKKTYQLRAAAKAEVKAGKKTVTSAARGAQKLVQPGSSRAATLIEGTADQIAWLRDAVLPQLAQAGLAGFKVDHTTEAYAVIARA